MEDTELQYQEANFSQRTPLVLVLDSSSSMNQRIAGGGKRIEALNEGLQRLKQELMSDEVARTRVQVAAITVGGTASLEHDFIDADQWTPPVLSASGATPLGAGMLLAHETVERGKQSLRKSGCPYTRPWVITLSDGEPTDSRTVWNQACEASKVAEAAGKFELFSLGVDGGDLNCLSQLSAKRPALPLNSARFSDFFVWVSAIASAASRSKPNGNLQLPSPASWMAVAT